MYVYWIRVRSSTPSNPIMQLICLNLPSNPLLKRGMQHNMRAYTSPSRDGLALLPSQFIPSRTQQWLPWRVG